MYLAKKLVSLILKLYYHVGGGGNILNSKGFIIGLSGALTGLAVILPLVLIVIILLCRCGKNHSQGKCNN